jgi:hypothetical protein
VLTIYSASLLLCEFLKMLCKRRSAAVAPTTAEGRLIDERRTTNGEPQATQPAHNPQSAIRNPMLPPKSTC